MSRRDARLAGHGANSEHGRPAQASWYRHRCNLFLCASMACGRVPRRFVVKTAGCRRMRIARGLRRNGVDPKMAVIAGRVGKLCEHTFKELSTPQTTLRPTWWTEMACRGSTAPSAVFPPVSVAQPLVTTLGREVRNKQVVYRADAVGKLGFRMDAAMRGFRRSISHCLVQRESLSECVRCHHRRLGGQTGESV